MVYQYVYVDRYTRARATSHKDNLRKWSDIYYIILECAQETE